MVMNHSPAVIAADEHIGRPDFEGGHPAVYNAADVFHARDPGTVPMYRHLGIGDVELHQTGVVEDSLPARPDIIPAGE